MPKPIPSVAPTFAVKLLHDRKSGQFRKVPGYSNKIFIFSWSEPHRAYLYHPKDLTESDDLFNMQGRLDSVVFAPISILPPPSAKPAAVIAPTLPVPPDTDTAEACIIRGIILTEDDSLETAQRLIRVHDVAHHKGEETANAKAGDRIRGLERQIKASPPVVKKTSSGKPKPKPSAKPPAEQSPASGENREPSGVAVTG